MQVTKNFIDAHIKSATLADTKEEKEKAWKYINACLKLNTEMLHPDVIKKFDLESKEKLGMLKENEYVITLKFGKQNIADYRFKCLQGKEDETIADISKHFNQSFTHFRCGTDANFRGEK